MSNKVTHKDRVKRVREYSSKNKLFLIIAAFLILFLIFGYFRNTSETEQYTDTTAVSESKEDSSSNDYTPHWRFYWSDLFIFSACVGGYAVIKIRRARKEREKL